MQSKKEGKDQESIQSSKSKNEASVSEVLALLS